MSTLLLGSRDIPGMENVKHLPNFYTDQCIIYFVFKENLDCSFSLFKSLTTYRYKQKKTTLPTNKILKIFIMTKPQHTQDC